MSLFRKMAKEGSFSIAQRIEPISARGTFVSIGGQGVAWAAPFYEEPTTARFESLINNKRFQEVAWISRINGDVSLAERLEA